MKLRQVLLEKVELTPEEIKEKLMVGVFPGGISYTDRSKNYKKIAFLDFSNLKLMIMSPRSPLIPEIKKQASEVQKKKGQKYKITTSGQYVILGKSA